jgi:uncharacterized membrane protein
VTTSFRRAWPVAFLLLGLVGLADATYLTAKKLTNGPIPCLVGGGCDTVTNSQYATFGPIPISAFGVAYYLAIVVLSLVVLDNRQAAWLRRLSLLTWIGFLFSLYLVAIMAIVLKAYCFYCLVSAGASMGLFLVGMLALRALSRPDKYGKLPPIQ